MVVGLEVPGDAELPAAGVKLQAECPSPQAWCVLCSISCIFLPASALTDSCRHMQWAGHFSSTASSSACASVCAKMLMHSRGHHSVGAGSPWRRDDLAVAGAIDGEGVGRGAAAACWGHLRKERSASAHAQLAASSHTLEGLPLPCHIAMSAALEPQEHGTSPSCNACRNLGDFYQASAPRHCGLLKLIVCALCGSLDSTAEHDMAAGLLRL